MLASSTAQAALHSEEEGSCDEIEDFVKSFIPSLFDSDSDSEDVCCLQSAGTTVSAVDTPQISRRLHVKAASPPCSTVSCEVIGEASSPSSQGNSSSLSAFHAAALEASGSVDEQSVFQSVLSITTSSASALDTFFEEERPAKRAKVETSRSEQPRAVPMRPIAKPREPEEAHKLPSTRPPCKRAWSPLSHADPSPRPPAAEGLPRPSSLNCLSGGGGGGGGAPLVGAPTAASAPAVLGGGVPPPGAPSAQQAATAPWIAFQQPPAPRESCHGFPAAPGPWPAPQGMIPTAPMSAFYPPQGAVSQAPLQPPPSPVNSPAKVSAALAELDAPLAKPPLGLSLDKASVMRQLKDMGMAVAGF